MDLYSNHVDKQKQKLKNLSLEDHKWGNKSWDHKGVEVVRLVCFGCPKEFGGTVRVHNKVATANIFINFK